MKIFLDDYRALPKSAKGFEWVKTYRACKTLIDVFGNSIDFIDLDYDLGTEETGYDILVYMKEKGIRPAHINIHSDHPEGAPEMRKYAEREFLDSTITQNKV